MAVILCIQAYTATLCKIDKRNAMSTEYAAWQYHREHV